jgi:hypothetical protein
MSSSYIENLGGGKFKLSALPVQAQVAPVNGVVVDDIDNDGNLDLVMVGNDYGNEVFSGRYDAFIGLVLKGDGKGGFSPSSPSATGFKIDGDAKALVKLAGTDKDVYVASQNKGALKAFVVGRSDSQVISPEFGDVSCEIKMNDGRTRKQEFYYGSGFLSQSGRKLRLPKEAATVTINSVGGKTRNVEVSNPK